MWKELTPKSKLKIGIAFGVSAFLVLFIIFNMTAVEVNFLLFKLEMSRSILLLLVAAGGFALGWIASSFRGRHRRNDAKEDQKEIAPNAKTEAVQKPDPKPPVDQDPN